MKREGYKRDSWQIENDANTLIRYKEITNDAERLADAQEELASRLQGIQIGLDLKPTMPASIGRGGNRATLGALPVPN